MSPLHLTPTSTRELVHLLILQELADVRRGGGVILKGGVNLRLFVGSPRYSEDMDLDGSADGSAAIRACVVRLFDDRDFTRQLQAFGIVDSTLERDRTRTPKPRSVTSSE